jgi:hypothetical protein
VTGSPAHGAGEFAKARARAESELMVRRVRATRTVAGQAVDGEDCARLLAMLGLDGADRQNGD